jgi:sporulation protein YlmC with PRC-barrel domain
MALKISKLYNMKVYDSEGTFIGNIHDVILNMESGEVIRVTLEPLKPASKEDATKTLKEKSVLYKNVKSVKEIMIVSRIGGGTTGSAQSPAQPEVTAQS